MQLQRVHVVVSLAVAAALALVGAMAVSSSTAEAASRTIRAAADASVQENRPRTNFGSDDALVVDANPARRAFIRFDVAALTGPVEKAVLRMHVTDRASAASDSRVTVASAGNAWTESTVTWDSQPAVSGTVGTFAPQSSGEWYEVDVTPAVTGQGSRTFALSTASNDDAILDAREAAFGGPELVITEGPPPTPTPGDEVLVGAGDIAGCYGGQAPGAKVTGDLIRSLPPTAHIFTAGDNAYDDGSTDEYNNCYDTVWGSFKGRTRPAPGNHEYGTPGGAGYYGYFGDNAGPAGRGYYSYDLGAWHVVSINSNCGSIPKGGAADGCAAGSPQELWLRQDLQASTKPCTVAYWHHPRFTSPSEHTNSTNMEPIWQALYDNGAEIVLSGHNHNYERFAPQTPQGASDPTRGIREFVVGSGGNGHYAFDDHVNAPPNSEKRNDFLWGVLKLTLKASGYHWDFLTQPGGELLFSDSGDGSCH